MNEPIGSLDDLLHPSIHPNPKQKRKKQKKESHPKFPTLLEPLLLLARRRSLRPQIPSFLRRHARSAPPASKNSESACAAGLPDLLLPSTPARSDEAHLLLYLLRRRPGMNAAEQHRPSLHHAHFLFLSLYCACPCVSPSLPFLTHRLVIHLFCCSDYINNSTGCFILQTCFHG